MASRSPADSASQRAAAAPARLSAFTSATFVAEPLEGPVDVACEARFDGLLERRLALAHDLVHYSALHAGRLQLREGLAGVDGIELLLVAHQDHTGDAERVGDPEQIARLRGRGERALVHHQHRLAVPILHGPLAPMGEPAFRDARVAGEEALQGLARNAGLSIEGARGRGRRRQPPDLEAALLQQCARPVQHGGLAGAGIALHPHNAVLLGQDQLHGLLLSGREGTVAEHLVDGTPAHRSRGPPLSAFHEGYGLALVRRGPVGGERVSRHGIVCGQQGAGLLQPRDGGLRLADAHRAWLPGEGGGEEVGSREHRLSLGEVRHGPGGRPVRFRRQARLGRPVPACMGEGLSNVSRLPAPGLVDELACIEAQVSCLSLPAFAQRVPVHVALVGAGHERRALREALVLRRVPQPLRHHRRFDLRAPGGEGLDDGPRNRGTPWCARNLEPPVRMGLLDNVLQLLQASRQLGAVERADQHLRRIELLVRHGAPLGGPGRSPVLALHHVRDHRMRVELGVEVARDLVAEGGDHRLLVSGAHHAAAVCIHRPGLDHVLLDPGEGPLHGGVVGGDDPRVAADQGRDGYGLGRREGHVPAGAVVDRTVPQPAAEPAARAVRHGAFEDIAEDVGIDRPGEPQSVCALARPGAGFPMRRIFLRVVPVALVVGDALGGRGDSADGGDHVRT